MGDESALLKDLLVATKDGDWGKDRPAAGLVPYHVIRGGDFPDVRSGTVKDVPLRYLDSNTTPRRTLQDGDILIETAGGTPERPTGRTLLIKGRTLAQFEHPVTCASFARFLRVDTRRIDSGYLFWHLQQLWSSGELWQHQVQHTGVARFQYTRFAATELIPLPPLPEQRAIAGVLGMLDDKIAANRRLAGTLEALGRAVFRSWFVDFDPVTARAAGRRPFGMTAAVADLFPAAFADSPLGPIPHGWSVADLPDIIEVNPTRRLPAGTVAPYLDMGNMPTDSARVLGWEERSAGSGMRFVNGDTLVARITPCLENGKTALVDFLPDGQVGWGSTEYIVLRSKPPLPPEFAYLLARTDEFRGHAIANMTGSSGRQRVPAECLRTLQVAVPSVEVAEEFGRRVRSLFAGIKARAEQSRTLAGLRDALLPRLLSGERRVRAAGRQIGEVR